VRTGCSAKSADPEFCSTSPVFLTPNHIKSRREGTRSRNSGDCQHGCCVTRGSVFRELTLRMRVRHPVGALQEEQQLCESVLAALDNPPITQPAAAPPADAVPLALGAP
jgi:hypothetical protein